MKLDIRTSPSAEPRRQAYGHIARRLGQGRTASRYEEAVLDVQATENFHYRPAWDPDFDLFDTRRTKIAMGDWYALLDPRQFYYATYTQSRAAMEATNAKGHEFAEAQGLFASAALSDEQRGLVTRGLLPLRHYEWGANRILWSVVERGYGTALTSAAAFNAMDRLGIAQNVTKLALALDGQTGKSLPGVKRLWLEAPAWQGVRRAVEDLMVVDDWYEALVGLGLVFDGLLRPLAWTEARKRTGTGVALVTQLAVDVAADQDRWLDALVTRTAKESAANKATLAGWFASWRARAKEACALLSSDWFGAEGARVVDGLAQALDARAAKLGIGEGEVRS